MSRIKKKFISFGTGSTDVNARVLPANFTPSNYTPTQVASEGTDKVSAHLKGIDAALLSTGTTYTATIANNQSSAQDVTSAFFDPLLARAIEVSFNTYRSTSTNELAATGTIYLAYLTIAGTWEISCDSTFSNAGLTFDITDAGQLTYTSSNLAGTSYSGNMKFTYKTYVP